MQSLACSVQCTNSRHLKGRRKTQKIFWHVKPSVTTTVVVVPRCHTPRFLLLEHSRNVLTLQIAPHHKTCMHKCMSTVKYILYGRRSNSAISGLTLTRKRRPRYRLVETVACSSGRCTMPRRCFSPQFRCLMTMPNRSLLVLRSTSHDPPSYALPGFHQLELPTCMSARAKAEREVRHYESQSAHTTGSC